MRACIGGQRWLLFIFFLSAFPSLHNPEQQGYFRGGHDVRARLSPAPSSKPIGRCPRPHVGPMGSQLSPRGAGRRGWMRLADGGWLADLAVEALARAAAVICRADGNV